MKNFTRFLATTLLTVLLSSTLVHAQQYAAIDHIVIAKYRPAASDVRALRLHDKTLGQMTDEQVAASRPTYVVKVFVAMPAPSAQQPHLLIDGQDVSYGRFSRGIFVKVYTKQQLVGWSGKNVVIEIPTVEPTANTPATVPFPSFVELTTREPLPPKLDSVLAQ